MCGATHPRNSQGVGKEGAVVLCKHMKLVEDVSGSNSSMVFSRMVLCRVVSMVVDSFLPVEFKLRLSSSVPEPVISHVPRFRSLLMDVVVYESFCSGVVGLDGRRRLWMT